jgi:hypothetical protein
MDSGYRAYGNNPNHPAYFHYSASGASRIDIIYLSRDFIGNKGGSDIIPAAVTNQCTVVISINMNVENKWGGLRHWRMNPFRFKEEGL